MIITAIIFTALGISVVIGGLCKMASSADDETQRLWDDCRK